MIMTQDATRQTIHDYTGSFLPNDLPRCIKNLCGKYEVCKVKHILKMHIKNKNGCHLKKGQSEIILANQYLIHRCIKNLRFGKRDQM